MTDRNLAEIMYPNQQGGSDPAKWHIELRYLPIAHRGHAFLALVDDKGDVAGELHGLAYSKHAPTKHAREPMKMGVDGSDLIATHFEGPKYKGMTRTFSGWDRDLLDPKYKRYVTPPVFPVKDAP